MLCGVSKVEKAIRDRKVIELLKSGVGEDDIARQLEMRPSMVTKVVGSELERIGRSRTHMAGKVFDLEVERLNAIIRNAWGIFTATCVECRGVGVFQEMEGISPTPCKKCGGDGKMYQPGDRLSAMGRAQSAIEQQSKMLGLFAPEKFAVYAEVNATIDFSGELREASSEDLEKKLAAFKAVGDVIDGQSKELPTVSE